MGYNGIGIYDMIYKISDILYFSTTAKAQLKLVSKVCWSTKAQISGDECGRTSVRLFWRLMSRMS